MTKSRKEHQFSEYQNYTFHPYNILLVLTLGGICMLFLAFSATDGPSLFGDLSIESKVLVTAVLELPPMSYSLNVCTIDVLPVSFSPTINILVGGSYL